MFHQRLLLLLTLIFSVDGVLSAQALFQKPVKVLGDPNFTGTAGSPLQGDSSGPNVVEGRELNFPLGVALDTSVSPPLVYIADTGNNRVLGFQYSTQLKPGSTADVILGQIDRFSNLNSQQNGRSTGMNLPSGLTVDASGNLYVADTGNNRILRYPKPLSQAAAPFPDLVIGQSSLSGHVANFNGISATALSLSSGSVVHTGLAIDSAGNLWVADTQNNRVLRFPASALKAGQNGPAADLVLGQPDFVTSTAATARATKTALTHPLGIAFDVQGRLLVTDSASRVLVYQTPIGSNSVAFRILGLDPMSTTGTSQIAVSNPFGVIGTSAGVIVPDTFNNRLLTFPVVDSWPVEAAQFSPSAASIVGQSSYTVSKINGGSADATASSFNLPVDVASSGTELFVVDAQNHRVLVFPLSPSGIAAQATRVIGQLDFPYDAPNLIEGKEFFLAASSSGSAVLDTSSSPPHLYVADTLNNRILGFNNFNALQTGTPKADLVIGQPDFFRSQINYPTNVATTPNAQGLNAPTGMALDSAGNLYVADTGNSRVLRFPAPFASGRTALESADLVIGQSDFMSTVTDPTAYTMNTPTGVALTADAANASVSNSGWLAVSDVVHNRVLFFQKPFASGMSATKILGSQNFTSSNAASGGAQNFNAPRGIAVDPQDRILVADTGNRRLQIFDVAKNIANNETPLLSLTTGLNQPYAVASSSTGFWVADLQQNAVLHFASSDPGQLAIQNYMSDTGVPVNSPRSAFVDRYGNLLVADGVDRVLYFAPEVKIVSAANGSGRPEAPGAVVSVYPAIATGIIANGTASASNTPLPIVLADTQVLVNNVASPLFFASPGQINAVLSNGLPSGGSVDLQVIRQSTGQIYGAEELPLSSAAPALFTSNLTGSGQVVAANIGTDGSYGGINSPSNPVARGQYILLYGSGEGAVSGAPADGSPATGAVPAVGIPQILIGSAFVPAANVQYSGLAPGLVGVWQINVLIPATAQTGSTVPIKVFQNSIPSTDPANPAQANTTIAIK